MSAFVARAQHKHDINEWGALAAVAPPDSWDGKCLSCAELVAVSTVRQRFFLERKVWRQALICRQTGLSRFPPCPCAYVTARGSKYVTLPSFSTVHASTVARFPVEGVNSPLAVFSSVFKLMPCRFIVMSTLLPVPARRYGSNTLRSCVNGAGCRC